MNKILYVLALAAFLNGCSQPETPKDTKPEINYQAEAEHVSQIKETVGYKLIIADQDDLVPVDDPIIAKTNYQLKVISNLSGIDEMSIADMALVGANSIRKERPNISISSLDILDVLIAVLPEQKDDLAAESINKRNLIASNIAHYGVMRFSMQHKEAKDSFVALLKEIKSPEFAQRINDYMNSQQ